MAKTEFDGIQLKVKTIPQEQGKERDRLTDVPREKRVDATCRLSDLDFAVIVIGRAVALLRNAMKCHRDDMVSGACAICAEAKMLLTWQSDIEGASSRLSEADDILIELIMGDGAWTDDKTLIQAEKYIDVALDELQGTFDYSEEDSSEDEDAENEYQAPIDPHELLSHAIALLTKLQEVMVFP